MKEYRKGDVVTIFWYSLRKLNDFASLFDVWLAPSSSLTMCMFTCWFSSFDESNIMLIGGGISSLSWMKTWHDVTFKWPKHSPCFYFYNESLDFKYYCWSLWPLFLCFSISSCVALMCSITSTSTLLFLYDALRIRKIIIFLCLTLVFSSAIGVVGCFSSADEDG